MTTRTPIVADETHDTDYDDYERSYLREAMEPKPEYHCSHELCHPLDRILSPFVRHNAWGGTGWRLPGMYHAFKGEFMFWNVRNALRNARYRWDSLWMLPRSFGKPLAQPDAIVLYEGETYGTGERVSWEPFGEAGPEGWGWLTMETWPEQRGDYLMGIRREKASVLLTDCRLAGAIAEIVAEREESAVSPK